MEGSQTEAKEIHRTHVFSANGTDGRIDWRMLIRKGRVVHFAINVSILDEEKCRDVFRIDTAHRGLHVQKFWISPKPSYMEAKRKDDYTADFREWKREVFENAKRWCRLWEEKNQDR